MELSERYADRHPATVHMLSLFDFRHLPEGLLRDTSQQCALLADHLVSQLADGAELTAGLRKLKEAKDCFVSQAVIDKRNN